MENNAQQKPNKVDSVLATRKKVTGSTMMFINNCVGDVLLTIACRFGELGLPLGIFLLCATFVYEVWAFRVISKACAFSNAGDLLDLIHKCYNKKFALFIDICAVAMLFAVLVCYVLIIASYAHQAWDWFNGLKQCGTDDLVCTSKYKQVEFTIRLIVGFAIVPFESLITSVGVLNMISSFAVIFVLVTLVTVVIRSTQVLISGELPYSDTYEVREPKIPIFPESILCIFTNFTGMFAMFSLQPVIPPLFEQLVGSKEFKKKVLIAASDIASTTLFIMYMIAAVLGCLIFYGENQTLFKVDNILVNFSSQDMIMSIVRIAYIIVIAVGYPVVIFQVRASLASWFKINYQFNKKHKLIFVSLGLGTAIVTSLTALITPSILVIFDPFCATFGAILFQLLPLLIWYKLPKLQTEYDTVDEQMEPIDRRTQRFSMIAVAASMLGGQSVQQKIETINRRISRVSSIKRPSLIGIDDDLHPAIANELAGDTKEVKPKQQFTPKQQKNRKIIFIICCAGIGAFNSVSFFDSIKKIMK